MPVTTLPSYILYTNDQAEPLRHDTPRLGAALRYTDHRFRGLFGGIWRAGRIYGTNHLGTCFGPEVFFPVGADDEEAWAAFGEPRDVVLAREAEVAQRALDYVEPIVKRFEGEAHLELARGSIPEHLLHVFLPARAIMHRFTPAEWFTYWKEHDTMFQRQARVPDSAGHA